MTARQLPCSEDPDAMFGTREHEIEKARKVCSGCPVRQECLLRALNLRDPWGVWGGKTPEERSAIIRGRAGQQPHIRRVLVEHVEAGTDPISVLTAPERAWLYQKHTAAGHPPHMFARRYRLSGKALTRIRTQAEAQTRQPSGQLVLAA